MTNKARSRGISTKAIGSWGSVWTDYNADGFPDLFVGRHGVEPLFYDSVGGHFERKYYGLTDPPGYDPGNADTWVDRHTCAWGEANGDGRLDLYCAVGANEGTSVGPNQLLMWDGDGFRDRARRRGLREPYGRSRTVNWLDFDGDGDLDVYVGNWTRSGHPSVLFRNDRKRFRRADVGLGDQLRTHSSSWADWDTDGDPDLLVHQYTAPTIAYENRSGRFVEVSIDLVTSGNWHASTWGDYNADGLPDLHLINDTRSLVLRNSHTGFTVEDDRPVTEGRAGGWFDLENDGDQDLFVVQGAPGRLPSPDSLNGSDLLLVRKNGRFVPFRRKAFGGPAHGSGDSVSVADFDRDGREDLLVTNGFFEYEQWRGRTWLLRNRTSAGSWVQVRLRGYGWNPVGLGGRVTVKAGGRTFVKLINDGVGFRTQSELGIVHFGIGSANRVKIRVRWKKGHTDCLTASAGEVVPVRRGSSPCN